MQRVLSTDTAKHAADNFQQKHLHGKVMRENQETVHGTMRLRLLMAIWRLLDSDLVLQCMANRRHPTGLAGTLLFCEASEGRTAMCSELICCAALLCVMTEHMSEI